MYRLNLTGPIGLVIGNEGEGVGRLVKETCDFTASIPMKGEIDSLNASVAAGVLAYEIVRQRLGIKNEGKRRRFGERYDRMTDEQLIEKLRGGDKKIMDYIMEKYKNLVRKEANAMYLLGGENEDLIQEGMIGLFKAVQDYDPRQESSFYSFARLCITRQLYTAIEASRRKKHGPLNSYVSLYDRNEEKEPLIETVEAKGESNPEELLISQEYVRLLESELEDTLSELENRVLYLHLLGTDYKTIARLLDRSPKTIDNALQRIKENRKILENIIDRPGFIVYSITVAINDICCRGSVGRASPW